MPTGPDLVLVVEIKLINDAAMQSFGMLQRMKRRASLGWKVMPRRTYAQRPIQARVTGRD
jgi:hypothetical protein